MHSESGIGIQSRSVDIISTMKEHTSVKSKKKLISHIQEFVSPPPAELNLFLEQWQEAEYGKGKILLEPSQTTHRIFFIKSGIIRFFRTENQKERTTWFAFENEMATDLQSCTTGKPGQYTLAAATPVEVLYVEFQHLEQLIDSHPLWEKVFRFNVQRFALDLSDRIYGLQNQPAKDRYEDLLSRHPNILQYIPLGQIASFIGVSLETVSRIRAQK
jgi:CRP/FNR family transcriptional regulator, anaerobic regulatory protein